ncbi:O-antigen acetylase [Serinicoccus hydrothermalis]|uniref:O-antigen acetylase n=1 Tax=Serinicoccus hydrothermalis TaxID=1758689 RepID=A0A1B1NCD8_9MICO|nr:acyltransferase family protein [Serinicoccus hydrothermalis]ANS79086.1 O-antigen acetylase [Serinicoccus hydrothermalis]
MRADIQTLRAVAVVLVLLWHAGVPGLRGGYVGVDVFLVVSGFLMTQILLTEVQERGRLDLPRFYLRRARRLLPAAAVTVVGVALITVALLPLTRWREVAGDIVASAFYVVNWRLAARSVDYLAADAPPSPLQHFWSLAVEEQFYLVWPVLLALVVVLPGRGRGTASRVALLAGVLGALSLAWSAWLSQVDPGRAYFVTTTRVWELALGAVLAALWPWWVARAPGSRVALALVGAGLGAVLASALLLDEATAFPGTAALLPTLGTVAVLLGGPFVSGAPRAALAWSPAQRTGDISYSLYLWHWPLLVAAGALTGATEPTWAVGLLVVALSFPVAWLSYRFVEEPFRGRIPRTTVRVTTRRLFRWAGGYALGCVVCAAAVVASVTVLGPGGPLSRAVAVEPSPDRAGDDVYTPFYDGCELLPGAEHATRCVDGDTEGTTRVVLVGDSHAVMWMPALAAAGAERGWRVELLAHTGCPAAEVIPMTGDRPKWICRAWLEEVTAAVAEDPPDVVLTAQVPVPRLWIDEQVVPSAEVGGPMAAGIERAWEELGAGGSAVATIMPTPRFEVDVPECVAEHPIEVEACGRDAAQALAPVSGPVEQALAQDPEVVPVDLTGQLCPQGWCPAVDDGVLVWTDSNHLSRTRSLQLAGPLGEALAAVAGTRR